MAILDVMMTSYFEGFDMAKKIFETPEFKNMPILIQTSIDVLSVSDPDVIQMAKEYRKSMDSKDLEVLLIQNMNTGIAGIDYQSPDGNSYWIPVNGFIQKPVNAKKLIPEVKRLLGL
jgi:hypothetical protein